MKQKLGYDDSLDVFGVHGVGGFVGIVLAGVFCHEMFGGNQGDVSIISKTGVQFYAAVVTVIGTAVLSWILLKITDMLVGLRVEPDHEQQGLDLALHEESGYRF